MTDAPGAPLPADPALGAVISHHPSNRLPPLMVAGGIGAPVMVILNFTLAESEAWYGVPLTVIIVAVLGLALGWYVLHIWNREIVLYERGFSYREGSKTIFFLYSEVRSLRLKAQRRVYFGGLVRLNRYRFTVHTVHDEQFAITNLYSDAPELGKLLEGQINPLLRQRIAMRLAQGERVPFSDTLSLSAQGLAEGGRELAWADFGGWRAVSGRWALLDASGAVWHTLPLPEIDNLTLLIEQLQAHRPPAAVARAVTPA
jgi:uncharacterized membrane protein YobD (UPF0266 family)